MKVPFLLAALIVFATAQGGTDNCNQPWFNSCNAKLGEFWQVDTSLIWTNLGMLQSVLGELIIPPFPLYNYVNVCNGFAQFYACLRPDGIQNCLGPLGFVGTGQSPQDAYNYEGMLADWRFKCGAGFFSVYENANFSVCTQSTYVNYGSTLSQYITSYTNNVVADMANACTYAQTLMNQVAGVYQNGPCRTVDSNTAYWYGCQSAREYTNAQFTHCRHVTTCTATSSAENFVRTLSDGKLEFLLPEHYEKNSKGDWELVPERYI